MAGRQYTPGQLLGLQAQIYRYSARVEIVSRVVDKTVGAIKTTLNTPV